jgi:uncharacterized protein with ParB-like and HNH nuclease domain
MPFIDANEVKIRNLLSNTQEAYKVPLYQRPYAWDEEQWKDLLEDVTAIVEDEMHFLGAIVVVPQGPFKHGINYFEVVDGQQRLATLLIALAAVRDLSREKGNEGFSSYINDTFLFAKDWEGEQEVKVPKLSLGSLDNDAFHWVLNRSDKKMVHLVSNCYQFFKNGISGDFGNSLQGFANILLDKVVIVHINAMSHLNAFRLFETLNDRGLELSAADLIKNYFLMKVSKDQNLFNNFIEEWNEMYAKVRDKEPVKFIRRYQLSSFSGKVTERRLYEELRLRVENENWNESKISEYVKNLNEAATTYKSICESTFPSKKINDRLRELHLIEVAPSYTLLLKIMPMYERGILSENDFLYIFDMIETLHIRWGICGQSTSRLDDIYNRICVSLNGVKDGSTIVNIITDNFRQEMKAVDNDFFYRAFSKSTFVKAADTRTKYILWKLSEPTGETILNIGEIQTEHIMPQKLSDDWVNYLRSNIDMEEEIIRRVHSENLNRMGNLTIIKGKWNIKMSNRLFDRKKEEYEKSEFPITKKLSSYPKWTFEEIEKRSEELAKLGVEKIWKL